VIVNADPAAGPFALFGGEPAAAPPDGFTAGMAFGDGVIEADLFVRDAAEVVALLMGCVPAGDGATERATGYELVLVPKEGRLEVRRVNADGVSILATVAHPFRTDAWNRLRLERRGGRLRAWLADDGAPFAPTALLEADDPQPLDRPGKVGLRALGGGTIARGFVVQPADGAPVRLDPTVPPSTTEARRRARRDLALVVLNLNEFVTSD
jgi:hypothetical protein